jgi:hypothetical protein
MSKPLRKLWETAIFPVLSRENPCDIEPPHWAGPEFSRASLKKISLKMPTLEEDRLITAARNQILMPFRFQTSR